MQLPLRVPCPWAPPKLEPEQRETWKPPPPANARARARARKAKRARAPPAAVPVEARGAAARLLGVVHGASLRVGTDVAGVARRAARPGDADRAVNQNATNESYSA